MFQSCKFCTQPIQSHFVSLFIKFLCVEETAYCSCQPTRIRLTMRLYARHLHLPLPPYTWVPGRSNQYSSHVDSRPASAHNLPVLYIYLLIALNKPCSIQRTAVHYCMQVPVPQLSVLIQQVQCWSVRQCRYLYCHITTFGAIDDRK